MCKKIHANKIVAGVLKDFYTPNNKKCQTFLQMRFWVFS